MRTWCSHASYSLRLTWSETVLFSVPMRFSKLPTEDCRLSSVEFKLLFSDKILSSTYDQNVSMRAKRLKQKHIVIECFCFGFTRATKANLSWFYRTRFPTRTRLLITAVKTMIRTTRHCWLRSSSEKKPVLPSTGRGSHRWYILPLLGST